MRGHGNAHLVDPSAAFHANGDEPCIGRPALFFPDPVLRLAYHRDIAAAIALCGGCPRQFECLAKAKHRGERNGVWGGVNFDRGERRTAADTCPDCQKRTRHLALHRDLVHRTTGT